MKRLQRLTQIKFNIVNPSSAKYLGVYIVGDIFDWNCCSIWLRNLKVMVQDRVVYDYGSSPEDDKKLLKILNDANLNREEMFVEEVNEYDGAKEVLFGKAPSLIRDLDRHGVTYRAFRHLYLIKVAEDTLEKVSAVAKVTTLLSRFLPAALLCPSSGTGLHL